MVFKLVHSLHISTSEFKLSSNGDFAYPFNAMTFLGIDMGNY
jgi:hypothetical protein